MDIDEKGWITVSKSFSNWMWHVASGSHSGGSWSVWKPNLPCCAMVEQQPRHRNLRPEDGSAVDVAADLMIKNIGEMEILKFGHSSSLFMEVSITIPTVWFLTIT